MAEAGRIALYPEARPTPAAGQRRFSWRSWLIGLFVWLLVGLAVGWLLGHYRIRLTLQERLNALLATSPAASA